MARARHPTKEIEKVMADAELHGWVFGLGSKYWKGKCACGQHMKTVKSTPSGGNYTINLARWFQRQPCW